MVNLLRIRKMIKLFGQMQKFGHQFNFIMKESKNLLI